MLFQLPFQPLDRGIVNFGLWDRAQAFQAFQQRRRQGCSHPGLQHVRERRRKAGSGWRQSLALDAQAQEGIRPICPDAVGRVRQDSKDRPFLAEPRAIPVCQDDPAFQHHAGRQDRDMAVRGVGDAGMFTQDQLRMGRFVV